MKTAILINNTDKEYHIGCYNVIVNICKLCKDNNIQLINSFTRRDITDSTRNDTLRKNLNEVDIIIINGEGSLHHHPRRSTNWFPIILKAIPKNKKAVLINTLWQEMEKLNEDLKYLDNLVLISVRETYSYNNLLSVYPKKEKIIITPDIIFATELEKEIKKIGYGDSVSKELRDKLKKEKIFFPLGFIDKGTYRNISQLIMPSIDSYKLWLSSLDLYITGRFHGVCLASLVGVPFLALTSNSHKIEGILKDMNCEDLLINSLKEVENKISLAKKLSPKAHQYALEAKQKIENLFKRISQL